MPHYVYTATKGTGVADKREVNTADLFSDDRPQTVVGLAASTPDDTASARLSPKTGIDAGRGTRLAPMRLRRRAEFYWIILKKSANLH